MERGLAAVLAADVVGYSRLMGIDEAGTLDGRNLLILEHEPAWPRFLAEMSRLARTAALIDIPPARTRSLPGATQESQRRH